jgi:hypothetical protein
VLRDADEEIGCRSASLVRQRASGADVANRWLLFWRLLSCPAVACELATVSGGRNISQPSCPAFQSSCPADGYSAGRGLQPAPVRVPAAAHTERVNALLDACVRPKSCDAGRRALFGETSLHDAYTAISQIPIRFTDRRRDMPSKQLVNGAGA